jgi:hypothetical protein
MSFLVEIVLTQSIGILLGLAAIYYIRPDTTGGAFLLMIIAVALSNAVQQIYKRFVA